MREYLKTTRYRLGTHDASMSADSKSASAVHIGVPLAIALLSAFGWYASSFAKQSPSLHSTHQAPAASVDQDAKTPTTVDAGTQSTTGLHVTQSQATDDAASQTKLYINSEEVAIPDSGTVHKVIQNDTSTTTVDVSVDASSHGSTEQSSSMSVEVYSGSETDTQLDSEEGP